MVFEPTQDQFDASPSDSSLQCWRRVRAEVPRIYAIGNVNGRLKMFRRLLGMIEQDNAKRNPAVTRIVLLGNLIGGGGQSASVVDLCRQIQQSSQRFMVVKGNHEEVMVRALRGDKEAMIFWLARGGGNVLKSWGVNHETLTHGDPYTLFVEGRIAVQPEVFHWLEDLPIAYFCRGYRFMHGSLTIRDVRSCSHRLVRDSAKAAFSLRSFGKKTIYGNACIKGDGRIGSSSLSSKSQNTDADDRLTALGIEPRRFWTLRVGGDGGSPPSAVGQTDAAALSLKQIGVGPC